MGLVGDNHDREEEGNYIELRLDFFEGEEKDEDGNPEITLGQIQMHSHRVPNNLYVDTMLVLARECIQQGMAASMFSDNVPEEVKRMATAMLATNWLIQRLQDPSLMNVDPVSARVPDDISSLLDGD